MADALSISMGGRVASIYKKNTKRRRFTTVVNEIETKRLGFIKKQLESDRSSQYNRLERSTEKMTNANDEMKAFQIALLRRIGVVKEQSKLAQGTRPLFNLGRYGGASVEYIKAESEKYKRIRDPKKRRMIKAKIFLEQSKRDGRIKEFEPEAIGNLAEDILKLYKAEPAEATKLTAIGGDVANLDDVIEADEDDNSLSLSLVETGTNKENDMKRATYPVTQPRRLVLPPLQVKRSLNPNSNYYRKISADYHRREAMRRSKDHVTSPIHKRLSILEDIAEEGDHRRQKQQNSKTRLADVKSPRGRATYDNTSMKFPVTSLSNLAPQVSSGEPRFRKERSTERHDHFEWEYAKPIGPLRTGKYFNESQRFWKPQESLPSKPVKNIALPSIE